MKPIFGALIAFGLLAGAAHATVYLGNGPNPKSEQALQSAGDDDYREALPHSGGGKLRDVPMQTFQDFPDFPDIVVATP